MVVLQQRVFIIHGHHGSPDQGWIQWLARELTSRGIRTLVPPMPTPDEPDMALWISYLRDVVRHCDDETYFVGYSLGCQAVLRYLQHELPAVRVGGAVFVAGFEHMSPAFYEHPDAVRALYAWLTEPIHWEAIRGRSRDFVGMFSDNDPWVPLENVKVFDEKLEARTRVLHARDHFDPAVMPELPEALEELFLMQQKGTAFGIAPEGGREAASPS